MRALTGLPSYYNQAAVMFAKTLPQQSLSDDPLMQLLQALDSVEKGALAQSLSPLRGFIQSSESLLASEYGPIARFTGTSLKDLWLPIIFLGRNWSFSVESLLGIPAKSWDHVNRVQSIVFLPITQRENPRLRVRLYKEILGVSRSDYKEFESCIKIPFGLRTTYKGTENCIGFIDNKSQIIEANNEDAERMLIGNIPTWLALLLKWDAVEQIELNYRHEPGEDIYQQISSIVVIPECPSGARMSSSEASAFLDNCFDWLGVVDSRARVPASVLIVQTVVGEEWYQMLNVYGERLGKFLSNECGFKVNLENKDLPKINLDLYQSIIQRHLIFQPESDLRDGEFNWLAPLFEFETDDAKGRIFDCYSWPNKIDLSDLIKNRIGNTGFLIKILESLKDHCHQFLENNVHEQLNQINPPDLVIDYAENNQKEFLPSSSTDSSYRQKPAELIDKLGEKILDLIARSGNEIFESDFGKTSKPVTTSLESKNIQEHLNVMNALSSFMFRSMLGVFCRNLDIGLEVIRLIDSYVNYPASSNVFIGLADKKESSNFSKAIAFLLHSAVYADSDEKRREALAGALYVFDANATAPERGPDGVADDEFCVATTLVALEEKGLFTPEEISSWAFEYKANIDVIMSSDKQRQVCSTVERYSSFLRSSFQP